MHVYSDIAQFVIGQNWPGLATCGSAVILLLFVIVFVAVVDDGTSNRQTVEMEIPAAYNMANGQGGTTDAEKI